MKDIEPQSPENFWQALDRIRDKEIKKLAPKREDGLLDKIGKRLRYHFVEQRYFNWYYNPTEIRYSLICGGLALSTTGMAVGEFLISKNIPLAVMCTAASLISSYASLMCLDASMVHYDRYKEHYNTSK